MDRDRLKQAAAEEAVKAVRDGMLVGLGHGTTARFALLKIAERIRSGELPETRFVPCSEQVASEAKQAGIPLVEIPDATPVDLTIDGADEVDPVLDVIKGAGGALVREKIVAQATRHEIIVVDDSKLSDLLGTKAGVPVEVAPFGWSLEAAYIRGLGARVTLRLDPDGSPFRSDQGNYILDCRFGPIRDARKLGRLLDHRAGVMGHGLFLGLVETVIVASPEGVVTRSRSPATSLGAAAREPL